MKITNTHILIISGTAFLSVVGIVAGFGFLALAFMAGYCLYVFHRKQALTEREWIAEIKNRETDADFRSVVVSKIGVLAYNAGDVQFFAKQERSAAEGNQITGPDTMQGADPMPEPVLPIIIDAPCVLLWGGRGRGKTNLARFVLEERRKHEDVLIIDPKETAPQTWPGYRIAGTDHNYQEIIESLAWVNSLHKHRITILIDELTILKMRIPNFSQHWLQPLIEGRERGQSLWIIGQSKTAGSLGLSGMYDILESFDFVVGCFYKKSTGERWAVLEEEGEPKRTCSQPGEFPPVRFSFDTESGTVHSTGKNAFQDAQNGSRAHRDKYRALPSETSEIYAGTEPGTVSHHDRIFESMEEKTIIEMWLQDESMNSIAKAVWGSSNGRRTAHIKTVLGNYGFSF